MPPKVANKHRQGQGHQGAVQPTVVTLCPVPYRWWTRPGGVAFRAVVGNVFNNVDQVDDDDGSNRDVEVLRVGHHLFGVIFGEEPLIKGDVCVCVCVCVNV